jgi:uncharacterized UPF0160 family protein
MSFFKKNKILVTHNGTFHADDIFATATLSILLDGNIKVIRTRDEEWFKKGDYVYDVGGEYDPNRNRFDHHQKGGAGKRDNGVPYAAFGLVWKAYGEKICGSKEVADRIDEHLVQAIDIHDNGVDSYKVEGPVGPYLIESMFNTFRPSWKEPEEFDAPFMELVSVAKKLLLRKIKKAQDSIEGEFFVKKAYKEAIDKRIIVLDDQYPWRKMFLDYPEPIYVVVPKMDKWNVYAAQKESGSFENRKSLPESWAGLRDEELARASGVPDATFCHNGRFLAVAKSKEGAIALAEKALLA